MKLLAIIFAAVFTNNFILSKFLGICPFLGVSKKTNTAFGMSLAVLFVMLLASIVCYPINCFLEARGMEYLQTLVFILVIAALVQLVELVLKRHLPALYQALGIYLPLITTNCAVLGVVTLNVSEAYGFAESVANAFGAGLGFLVAMLIFSGVREHLEGNDIPDFWKGLPATLVAAAFTACSFLGFAGVAGNLFGM